MKILDCIPNLIGLTRKACPCWGDKPTEWEVANESVTGLYVDNIDWLIQVKNQLFADCGTGNIYELLKQAREEALVDLVSQIMIKIGQYQTKAFGNVKFKLGEIKTQNNNHNVIACDHVGIKISPQYRRGTVLNISKIALVIDEVQDYTINLYKCGESSPIETVVIPAGSNNINYTTVDWIIPVDDSDYYIVYDRQGGMPYDHDIYCPTCSSSKPGYWSYATAQGICLDNQGGGCDVKCDSKAYGLLIEGSLQCDYLSWLCAMDEDFWCSHEWGIVFAKMWQMLASIKFNTLVVNRRNIDVWTTIKKESIYKLNAKAGKIVRENIQDLASSMPNDFSDCFTCQSAYNMKLESNIVIN